jgi:glycosyltransferase involved in cell wall biosynthesis
MDVARDQNRISPRGAGGGNARGPASDAPQFVVLSDALTYPPRAGYHIHLHAIARSLPRSVPSRVFCWVDPSKTVEANGADGEHRYIEDVSARAPGGNLGRKIHYARWTADWLKHIVPRGSVVWVRGYSTALSLLPRLGSLSGPPRSLRFVYDASSFMSLEAGGGMGGLLDTFKGMVEERLWRQFPTIRTLGDPMRDFLIHRGVPAERIHVIPVGSDRRSVRWRPHDPPVRLLYLGSARAWQGLPKLLRAMEILSRQHPEIHLTVVGVDDLPSSPRLPNVDFRGRVGHREAMQFYLESDLLVIPRERTRLTETVVPMKVVEAMSYGIPLLANDLAAIRWVAGDSGALYAPDNDPHTLAEAIPGALNSRSDLERVSRSALERVEDFYWDRIGERIGDLFFRP